MHNKCMGLYGNLARTCVLKFFDCIFAVSMTGTERLLKRRIKDSLVTNRDSMLMSATYVRRDYQD